MPNLFNLDPLFEQTPEDEVTIRGLFPGFGPGVTIDDSELDPTPQEQRTINKEIDKVNERTVAAIEKVRDQGILARYPVIETREDEQRERARLRRRGLKPEEVSRRIQKFKEKGGRIKTSSKLLLASQLLAGGIQGYLATKQGRPLPRGTGLSRVRAEAETKLQQEIERIEKRATEQKALLIAGDEFEMKKAIEEIKADAGLRKQVAKEARELGVSTRDEKGNLRPVEDVSREVITEQARRQAVEEDLATGRDQRAEEAQARARVQLAVQVNDPGLASDRDLAIFWEIDPQNQTAIDEVRGRMESKAKVRSFTEQETLLGKEVTRQKGERALTEPLPPSPEEEAERRAQERQAKVREKAALEYQAKMPALLMGLQMFEDDPAVQQGMLMERAQLLMVADPETFPDLGVALQKVQADLVEMQKTMAGQGSFLGSILQRSE
jgi:hypothetical protein